MEVVPDDFALIEDRLHHYVDDGCALIFTTGGTGLTPDDVTPEATRAVIERDAPGFAEAMRAESLRHTPMGILTRGVSGHRRPHADRQLPRQPEGGRASSSRVIAPTLRHVVDTLHGEPHEPAIELERRSTRRYGERVALDGRDAARSTAGATLVVFGPNGAGKSTLLRILATLLRPHAGTVARPRPRAAGRGLGGARAHRPPRPRPAALPRADRAREPALPRAPARRREAARSTSCSSRPALTRARRRARPHAVARDGPARSPSAARSCTTRSCCCSTSRARTSTPAASTLVEPLIGRACGRTRVVTSHDPRGGLAEADVVLGLRGGRAGAAGAPADDVDADADRGAVPMRRAVGALLRKDLRLELRTLESIPAMTLFAVTTFVVFHFGLDRATLEGDLAAGVLWVTLLFAAILGQNRLFVAEHEQGGFDGFLLAPVDRTALLVAKAIALFALPGRRRARRGPGVRAPAARPDAARRRCPGSLAVLLLADVGIAVVGTLVAGIAIRTRARDLIGPLLTLPLLVPVVLAASRGDRAAARRGGRERAARALAGDPRPL